MMWQNIFQDVQSKLNEPSAIFSFAPVWIVSALLLVGAFAVAWLIHAIVLATLRRIFGDRIYVTLKNGNQATGARGPARALE